LPERTIDISSCIANAAATPARAHPGHCDPPSDRQRQNRSSQAGHHETPYRTGTPMAKNTTKAATGKPRKPHLVPSADHRPFQPGLFMNDTRGPSF
jgi:hypothetical protein